MKTTQMQSCVHDNGTVECTLVEVELPEPGPEEVVVEIEAAPINPCLLYTSPSPRDS